MSRLSTSLKTSSLLLLLGASSGYAVQAAADSVASHVLEDYVAKPDASFSWSKWADYRWHGAELMELRLHSQTWQDSLWKHRLVVIKPRRIKTGSQALMVVMGGRWRPEYDSPGGPEEIPDDFKLFARIANRLHTVVAVVAQVPYQPLYDLTEDDLIAYTFDQYLDSGNEEWPLLLPMVKSVVRAMDATVLAARSDWGVDIEGFTLTGGSKRGWTTWLTAAADGRIRTLAPMVIDALNMEQHFPYQTDAWGEPSEAIRPYTDRDLHIVLSSDEGEALRNIVDPYAYRSALEQPKLIIVATNDEYFPVDSLNLYWAELADPKYILYMPNARHSDGDLRIAAKTLNALHRKTLTGEMPVLDWDYEQDDHGLRLTIGASPKPRRVRLWQASSDDRDFRDAEWTPVKLQRIDGSRYAVEIERPENGYVAVFGNATFGRGLMAYSLSTNLCVIAAAPEKPAIAERQRGICPDPRANAARSP